MEFDPFLEAQCIDKLLGFATFLGCTNEGKSQIWVLLGQLCYRRNEVLSAFQRLISTGRGDEVKRFSGNFWSGLKQFAVDTVEHHGDAFCWDVEGTADVVLGVFAHRGDVR